MPSLVNLIGKRFGRLVVIERVLSSKKGAQWLCQCDCGAKKVISSESLIHNRTKSCGCFSKESGRKRNLKDITGQQFNRLTVIKFSHIKYECAYWLCKCSCGKEKIIRGTHLRSGITKSCGCLTIEKSIERNTTHGMTGTKEYNRYRSQKYNDLKKAHDTDWNFEKELFLRNLFQQCVVCGMTEAENKQITGKSLHVDHVRPLSKGNGLSVGNATVLCYHCNEAKQAKALEDLPERMRNRIQLTADLFKLLWEGQK